MSDSKSPYAFTLTPLAYTIPILHAAHHLSTVLGVFLGRVSPSSSKVIIEEAIPLIHHYTSLSPMTEIALELAEAYAQEKGLRVVGMYLAPASGTGLGRVGEKVLGALRERFDGAFGMAVDNAKLATLEIPYSIYLPSSSSNPPKPLPTHPTSLPEPFTLSPSTKSIPAEALRLIREEGLHKQLGDFDDHLEDSRVDWLGNERVKEGVRKCFA